MTSLKLPQAEVNGRENRASRAILATIVVLIGVWGAVVTPLLLEVIRSAYQLESIPILNDLIQDRETWPVEYYLAKGRSLSTIALLSVVAYLLVLLMVLRPELFGKDAVMRESRWRLQAALLIVSLIAIIISVVSGPQHDYIAYLQQWDLVITGADDPWGEHSSNAYGPAYNLFALPYSIHPLLPKLLFCFTWLCCSVYVIALFVRQRMDERVTWLAFAFLALNPLFWASTVIHGNFDIVVAAACLAAVAARWKRQDTLAALLLALAVLLKYYPLALAPFLMFDGWRFNRRFALVFGASVLAGMLASVLVWGASTFDPLLFSMDRGSKSLSIFRFLRGELSPLRFLMESPNLDPLSTPVLIFGGGLVFALVLMLKMPVIPASIVGIATGLTLYKVGHSQFLAVVILLLWYWWARERLRFSDNPGVTAAILAYCSWIGAVSAMYVITAFQAGTKFGFGGRWEFLRDFIGLPTFVLAGWMIAEIVKYQLRAGRLAGNDNTRNSTVTGE